MNNKVNDKTYIKLTPFKGWVLENFPFIESDFDCITNYQLLCKITEYLNNVISNQNQVQQLGTELVTAYNQLLDYVNNYFENTYPELINNKLDEMAEDGTLENLLNDKTHLLKSYNTYDEMILDSENFTSGLRIKTYGYHSVNDGGNAEYIVTDTIHSGKYQVKLENSLYLELIYKTDINVECFGCVGDGETDNSTYLQNAINFCQGKAINLIFRGIYKINSQINISLPIIFKGVYNDKSTILMGSQSACINLYNENNPSNLVYNLRWYKLKLDGNKVATTCLKGNTSQSYFEKIFFINATNGVDFTNSSIVWFKDCYFYYLTNAIKTHRMNSTYLQSCNCWDNDNIINCYGESNNNGRITSLFINDSWLEGYNTIITRNSYVDAISLYMEQTASVGAIPSRRTSNYIYRSSEPLLATLSLRFNIRQCDFTFTGSSQTDGLIILDNTNDSYVNFNDSRVTKPNTITCFINTDSLSINKYQTKITCNSGGISSVSDLTKCVFTDSTNGYYGDTTFPNGLVIGTIQPAPNASLKEGQLIMNDETHIMSMFANNAWRKLVDNTSYRTQLAYGQTATTTASDITVSESINNFRLILIQIRSGLNVTNTHLVDLATMNKMISNGNKTTNDGTERTITITKNSGTSLTLESSGGTWYVDIYGFIRA